MRHILDTKRHQEALLAHCEAWGGTIKLKLRRHQQAIEYEYNWHFE